MHQMMYQPMVATTPSKDKELADALKGIQQQLQGLNRQNQQQRRPDYRQDNRPHYRQDNRDWNRNNTRPQWPRDNGYRD